MTASLGTDQAFPLLGQASAILDQIRVPKDLLAARKVLDAHVSPEVARAAIELDSLRLRAASKMPGASRMLLTRKGLEQATDYRVCLWRSTEIQRLMPGSPVFDATTGMGAESLALSSRGLFVVSADLDPLHSACCRANLKSAGFPSRVLVADATKPIMELSVLILDPDRRAKSGLSGKGAPGGFSSRLDPSAWSPSLTDVVRVLAKALAGCVKLPPGVDVIEIEALLDAVAPDLPRRFTWTESGNDLRELALWTGELAPASEPRRRAIRILGATPKALDSPVQWLEFHDQEETQDQAAPLDEPSLDEESVCGSPGEQKLAWLIEPRASVIRAGLIGPMARKLGAAPIDAHMAYLGKVAPTTEDVQSAVPPVHPLARTYRVLDGVPLDRKRVRKMLRDHDVGKLTVKKRGHRASADELAARFRGPGGRPGWLIVGRIGTSHRAFLVEPVE
jgi:hypothetical protein